MNMDKETYSNLEPEEQRKVFCESSIALKGDLLRYSHEPERLTQSLSEEELYLVTKELDIEDRAEIIKHANLPQLFFISDIDCWDHDRIKPQGFLGWLEALQYADDLKLLAWLISMDYETVVAGFMQLIEVIKPDWEYASDELLKDKPVFTLDQQYYIFVSEENQETVRKAIELLYENHRGRYVALLEGIIAELLDVVEEEGFRKREIRLAERGFPDAEAALKIFTPMSKDELMKSEKKHRRGVAPADNKTTMQFLVPRQEELLFFDQVFLNIRQKYPETMDMIEEELVWLANKVIASEGIDLSSEENIKKGVECVRCVLSIGLEDLASSDISVAEEFVRDKWLEFVFRYAMNCHQEVRLNALGVIQRYWGEKTEAFLNYWEGPYEMIFRGLLRKLPQYYESKMTNDVGSWRPFRSLKELERTQLGLQQVDCVLRFLFHEAEAVMDQVVEDVDISEQKILWISCLGTMIAQFVLNQHMKLEALSNEEGIEFAQKAFELKEGKRYWQSHLKDDMMGAVHSGEEISLMRPLWGIVFQEMEDDFKSIENVQDLDGRFIRSVWWKE